MKIKYICYVLERIDTFSSYRKWLSHEREFNYDVVENYVSSLGTILCEELFNECLELYNKNLIDDLVSTIKNRNN